MSDLIARLRQLEAAATPGPWRQEGREVAVRGWSYWSVFIRTREEDVALTVAARNALPQLLAVAEAAQALEQLGSTSKNWNRLAKALAALDSQETE